jgi:hypothetical protein
VSAQQDASKIFSTTQDLGTYEWVDKNCRVWSPDGDIDIDQTCLVIRTVRGGLVVIPNKLNDGWIDEMSDPQASNDKWLQRFLEIKASASK